MPAMTTWVVGDIHGCAAELEKLLDSLQLGEEDRLIAVGDLFHRGPDPAGVLDLLVARRAAFVIGNHEQVVLKRAGLAPELADGSDRPALRTAFPELDPEDLAGDGARALHAPRKRLADFLVYLQQHAGYFLDGEQADGDGRTRDGQPWCIVHAGLVPGRHPSLAKPDELCRLRRLRGPGRPFWYEVYKGPDLVLFGHTPSRVPRACHAGGRLVALGLDTGCVYGGHLTAYCPQLDELARVPALRAYAQL
jgi:hypothetical protein